MASRRSSRAKPPRNTARRARQIICAALGMVPFCAAPISAQQVVSDSPTLHGRIEAAAKMLQNNPRLKGLTEQQLIDRVEFVAANTLVLLLHELGHVHIAEMRLQVLGREEDAADTFAALTMLKIGTSFSQHELAQAAKGWFLNDLRDQQTGETPLYYGEHNLNQQRAYQILCLMVGSDPNKFKSLADEMKLPESRQKTCKRDFAKTSAAWGEVLMPWHLEPGQPETEIKVIYNDGQRTYDAFANMFRSIWFLETVAEYYREHYRWPQSFTLKMETCGHPGADYDDEARVVTMCYETPFDFAELYRAYVEPPSVPAAAPAPAAKKRKSR